jgi:hypothetical protein
MERGAVRAASAAEAHTLFDFGMRNSDVGFRAVILVVGGVI